MGIKERNYGVKISNPELIGIIWETTSGFGDYRGRILELFKARSISR